MHKSVRLVIRIISIIVLMLCISIGAIDTHIACAQPTASSLTPQFVGWRYRDYQPIGWLDPRITYYDDYYYYRTDIPWGQWPGAESGPYGEIAGTTGPGGLWYIWPTSPTWGDTSVYLNEPYSHPQLLRTGTGNQFDFGVASWRGPRDSLLPIYTERAGGGSGFPMGMPGSWREVGSCEGCMDIRPHNLGIAASLGP